MKSVKGKLQRLRKGVIVVASIMILSVNYYVDSTYADALEQQYLSDNSISSLAETQMDFNLFVVSQDDTSVNTKNNVIVEDKTSAEGTIEEIATEEIQTEEILEIPNKEEIEEVLSQSIVPITVDEYYDICRMTFSESGYVSWEMQNACASTAVYQMIVEEQSMTEVLYTPGRYGFHFTDYDHETGKKIAYREVEISDITPEVYDAVNHALLGYDVLEDEIHGTFGFWAPNHCSDSKNKYFLKHTSGRTFVENVCFFHEWIPDELIDEESIDDEYLDELLDELLDECLDESSD